MLATDLPGLNAFLNTLSATFLGFGFYFVRRRQLRNHRIAMLLAIATSTLFLCSYVIYHVLVGSVPYPYQNWTRIIYFAILFPHIILAMVMLPFILLALWHAYRGIFQKLARITRWIWPVWMYVSVSGVVIYLMLYRL